MAESFNPTFCEYFPDLLEEGHCVMVPIPSKEEIMEYIERIPESILYQDESNEYGKETMPHVTVLYGILPLSEEKTKNILKRLPKNIVATLGSVSLFENDKFDVLKVDVTSPHLDRINEFLCKNVEYHNDYPNYKPHMTLAYLKKGTGKPYVGDRLFEGKKFKFETFIYSNDTRKHDHIPMKEYANLGLGGGYGVAAGGPVAGSWGATFSSPAISGPRMPRRKTQPGPKGGPGGINNTMQGNTITSAAPYDGFTDKDLQDPRFSPDEIRQGLRYEMKSMEYPDKDVARRIVIQHLEKNAKYYSDLWMYNISGDE